MTRFAVIGAGTMGRALTQRFARAGVDVGVTDLHEERMRAAEESAHGPGRVTALPVEEAVRADVVLLALWYPDTIAFAARWAEELHGAVVVDLSNPLDDSYTRLTVPESSSAAEHLARRLPDSAVVKAFNTVTAATVADGRAERTVLDVFAAGDDADAKAQVLALIADLGLRGLDAGALDNARLLERLAAFGIELGQRYGFGFGIGFKFLPETPHLVTEEALKQEAATR